MADPENPPATVDYEGVTFKLMDSWPRDAFADVRYLAPIDVHEPDPRAVRPHST